MDIVWDIYLPNSLKSATREKWGAGERRRVEGSTQISVKWDPFLRNDQNKSELFHFLSDFIHKNFRPAGRTVVATVDDHVLSFPDRNNEFLQPCNHEEANTRMFVHVNDAITQDNFRSVLIHSIDKDVVVLAVNAAYRFNVEIFVAFGTGNSFCCIEAHQLAQKLGPEKCVAILLFHSFTGCDTTSFFSGWGKMSAWTVWELFDDVCALPMNPDNIQIEMPVLE